MHGARDEQEQTQTIKLKHEFTCPRDFINNSFSQPYLYCQLLPCLFSRSRVLLHSHLVRFQWVKVTIVVRFEGFLCRWKRYRHCWYHQWGTWWRWKRYRYIFNSYGWVCISKSENDGSQGCWFTRAGLIDENDGCGWEVWFV